MLSLVATPIGNLGDVTLRALEVLKRADMILCEDTRRTKKLLEHYGIPKPLFSFHEHSSGGRTTEILRLLRDGKHLALVSDGGMPVISDPGFEIVRETIREKIPFEVLPGASSVINALVASGLASDSFGFFGFPPNKAARKQKFFKDLTEREETLIFFESPFRVLKTVEEMCKIFGDREAVVARELTKKFEEIIRGTLPELAEELTKKPRKGEMVILVAGKNRKKIFS